MLIFTIKPQGGSCFQDFRSLDTLTGQIRTVSKILNRPGEQERREWSLIAHPPPPPTPIPSSNAVIEEDFKML